MPEEHFNVMDYYKNGTQDQRKKHKLWSALLDDMYDDNLNRIGMAKMYKVLQAANPEPGAYPTKRFIKDYLNRQHDNQVRKQPHSNNQDVIRSVITQRPNQIIMVDYLYFYWEANDLRGKGPIDDDDINDKTKQSKDNTTEVDKLFAEEKEKYRGVLVAIDVFSKYGYVEKIKGNINSEKAWKAMDNILKDANNKFGKEFGPVRIIQTDKGSEFMNSPSGNGFKENLIKINEYQKTIHKRIRKRSGSSDYSRHQITDLNKYKDYGLTQKRILASQGKGRDKSKGISYYLKHYYGYEGRSTAQSMVERLNRTLKTMTMRALNNKVVPGWSDLIATRRNPATGKATIGQILENYNSNYHSSIKTSPKKVSEMEAGSPDIEEVAQHIKDRAIKHGDIDQGAYKVGDFVRIKIFKPTKLGPKYTFNGGLAKIVKTSKEFDGVFVIHSVQKGSNSDQGSRQTTYRIVSNWSHESKVNSLPSGQTKARAGKQIVIKSRKVIEEREDDSNLYPKAAYGRNFTKSALSRVPTTDKGFPDSQNKMTYAVEAILSEEQVDGKTMYEVKWKDENDKTYDEHTYEPMGNLRGDPVFEKYQKDKKK